jgi:hypothetical protein
MPSVAEWWIDGMEMYIHVIVNVNVHVNVNVLYSSE